MLADARAAHVPMPEHLASRGSVSLAELSRESSVPMELVTAVPTDVPEAAARLADVSAGIADRQAIDVHKSFLR